MERAPNNNAESDVCCRIGAADHLTCGDDGGMWDVWCSSGVVFGTKCMSAELRSAGGLVPEDNNNGTIF